MPWTVRAVAIRRCQEIAARYPRRVTADVERIVYAGERVEVGAFRCPVEHPDFRDAGQIRDHCVLVFPRTAVRIRHAGQRAFTTDATVAVFYNPQQPFVRERVDPAGDRCEWFALDTETAAEVAAGLDPAAHAAAPFRFTHGPVDAASYYRQRALFQTLARPAPADALEIEEEVLALARRVLAQAYLARRAGFLPPCDEPDRREHAAVADARTFLARQFREPVTLGAVARAVGLSRFRLCHLFRRVCGTTLHAQREQLRLRAALDALAQGCGDLTRLALELGYSSHSHFTANFRRAFGRTPSQARAAFTPRATASAATRSATARSRRRRS